MATEAKARFQFKGYKVDQLNLEIEKSVGLLDLESFSTLPGEWKFALQVRVPSFFSAHNCYVCGVDCEIAFINKLPDDQAEKPTERILAKLNAGICGKFVVESPINDEKIENALVKIQAPFLLFSYLRSAITSVFASAGIGGVVLPLINIHELAETQLKDIQIERF